MSGTQTPTNMVTTHNHSIAPFPSESGTIEITVTSRIESGFISFVGCMREIFTLVDKLHASELFHYRHATPKALLFDSVTEAYIGAYEKKLQEKKLSQNGNYNQVLTKTKLFSKQELTRTKSNGTIEPQGTAINDE